MEASGVKYLVIKIILHFSKGPNMEAIYGSYKSDNDSKLHTWQDLKNSQKSMSSIKPRSYTYSANMMNFDNKRFPEEKFDSKTRWANANTIQYDAGPISKESECVLM